MWYELPWLGVTWEREEPRAALGALSHCYVAFPVLKQLFQAVSGGVSRPARHGCSKESSYIGF